MYSSRPCSRSRTAASVSDGPSGLLPSREDRSSARETKSSSNVMPGSETSWSAHSGARTGTLASSASLSCSKLRTSSCCAGSGTARFSRSSRRSPDSCTPLAATELVALRASSPAQTKLLCAATRVRRHAKAPQALTDSPLPRRRRRDRRRRRASPVRLVRRLRQHQWPGRRRGLVDLGDREGDGGGERVSQDAVELP